jgi:hypothetical protein
VQVAEQGSEALHPLMVEAARVAANRVTFEEGPGMGCPRDLSHGRRPEHGPPQGVIGGLVDEYMLLIGEEPGQRPGGQVVATIVDQVGGRAPHDQVDLQFGVSMRPGMQRPGGVSHDPPLDPPVQAQILEHRKTR